MAMRSDDVRSNRLDEVRAWLRSKHPGQAIGDHEDLIESRLIDSLQFLELVYLLQSLSGRPIDMDSLTVDLFRTLAAIEQNFLEDAAS